MKQIIAIAITVLTLTGVSAAPALASSAPVDGIGVSGSPSSTWYSMGTMQQMLAAFRGAWWAR
jgi:hypothetical protein